MSEQVQAAHSAAVPHLWQAAAEVEPYKERVPQPWATLYTRTGRKAVCTIKLKTENNPVIILTPLCGGGQPG